MICPKCPCLGVCKMKLCRSYIHIKWWWSVSSKHHDFFRGKKILCHDKTGAEKMTMQKVSPSSSPVDVSDITTKMNIWPANMGILTDSLRVLQKPIMSCKFSPNFFILRANFDRACMNGEYEYWRHSTQLKWTISSYLLRINNAFDIEVKLVPPASKLWARPEVTVEIGATS